VASAKGESGHTHGDHCHAKSDIAMEGRTHEHGAEGGAGEDGEEKAAGTGVVQMPASGNGRKTAAEECEADAGDDLHALDAEDWGESVAGFGFGGGQAGHGDGSRVDSRAISAGSTAT
jgi:hypothetical protein